jgi:hypothetical protein
VQISFLKHRPKWLKTLARRLGKKQPRRAPMIRASDADAAWQECIDKNLYGAQTEDYTVDTEAKSQRD